MLWRQACASHPVGRGARLDEISAAYLFLASAEAAAITGQVLRVDGGLVGLSRR